MKTIHLIRYYNNDDVTLGNLHIEGVNHKPIYTLENPWKDNQRNVSCIPVGRYKCEPFSGIKHRKCYQICDVQSRGYILIHVGNWTKDTQGCILVGKCVAFKHSEYMITNSQDTMRQLKELLNYEPFFLQISYQFHIGD